MNKIIILIFLTFTFTFSQTLNLETDFGNAMEKAINQKKKIVMFMYTDYCPWCKKMKETTFKKDTIIEDLNENYIVLFTNKDVMNYPTQLYPQVVPTTYIIEVKDIQNLHVVDGAIGFKNEDDFLSLLYKNH